MFKRIREAFSAPPAPKGRSTSTVDPNSAVSWAELSEILGSPPLGKPGTSRNPAGGVYGESNPNSRAYAKADIEVFKATTGRYPTATEQRMIEQRHLGWGYK